MSECLQIYSSIILEDKDKLVNFWLGSSWSLFVSQWTSANPPLSIIKYQVCSCLLSKVSALILWMNTFRSYGHLSPPSCTPFNDNGSLLVLTVMLTEDIFKSCVYWVHHLKISSRGTRALLTSTTSHFAFHHDLVGLDSWLSAPVAPFLNTSRATLRLSFPAVLCPSAVNTYDRTLWAFLYAAGALVCCSNWYLDMAGGHSHILGHSFIVSLLYYLVGLRLWKQNMFYSIWREQLPQIWLIVVTRF